MTPTSASYTISKDLTGYTSDQTINPRELKLWKVIKKNSDRTVEVVSEYVSSSKIYFKGWTGYMNLVGGLNTIAAQYTNTKYVSRTRHIGYSNQIEICTEQSITACPGDNGWETDNQLATTEIERHLLV